MVRIISTKKGRPLLPSLRSKYFFHLLLSLVLVAVAALGMVFIVIYYQFFQEYRQDTIDSTYANVASVESMLTQRLLDMKSTVLTSSSNVAFSYYPYENEQKEESVDAVKQLQTMLKVNRLYADVGFYRASEPEWIYTSKGQFSLRDFGVYLYQMESPADFNPVSFFNVYTGVSRQGSLKDETVYAFVDRLDAGIGKPRKFILLFVYKSAFDEIVRGSSTICLMGSIFMMKTISCCTAMARRHRQPRPVRGSRSRRGKPVWSEKAGARRIPIFRPPPPTTSGSM